MSRNTFNYDLKDGHRIVYRGTTRQDPEARAQQHRQQGKRFTHVFVDPSKRTPERAKAREAEKLEVYRQMHGGRNPKYNKDSDG